MSPLQTSALHLAACLGDGGSTAALLLLKYSEPRRLWLTLKDAQGATPLQYAMSSHIGHVNQLARALRASGEDSDEEGGDAMADSDGLEDPTGSMQSETMGVRRESGVWARACMGAGGCASGGDGRGEGKGGGGRGGTVSARAGGFPG